MEIRTLVQRLEAGLRAGALGLGLGIAYTPAADHEEIYRVFQLGASFAAPLYIHNRQEMKDLNDYHELFAFCAATGAPLHICHLGASAAPLNIRLILEMIQGFTARGIDVTAEVYPYTAGMTRLESEIFASGWKEKLKADYGDLEWVETGERLTAATFAERRKQGGLVACHNNRQKNVDLVISNPLVMVASDAIPWTPDGKGHPRGSGCFCRVLRDYVRERKVLTLTDAIRKMALMPARRLERVCSAFKNKGRLRDGADADIVCFNPDTVRDNATFANPMEPSSGVRELLVGGTFVVRKGEFVDGVTPGIGYRGDARTAAV